jgi:hypothetical protein
MDDELFQLQYQDILERTRAQFTVSDATQAPAPPQRTSLVEAREKGHAAVYAHLIANPPTASASASLLESRRFLVVRKEAALRHKSVLQTELDHMLAHREVLRREQNLRIGRPNVSSEFIRELYDKTYKVDTAATDLAKMVEFEAAMASSTPPTALEQYAFRREMEATHNMMFEVAHEALIRGGFLIDGDHGDQTEAAILSIDEAITFKQEGVNRAGSTVTSLDHDLNKVDDQIGSAVSLGVENISPLVKLLSHYGKRFPDESHEGVDDETMRDHLRFINRFSRRGWTIPLERIVQGDINFTYTGFDPVIQNLEALCSPEATVLNNLKEATAMALNVSPEASSTKFFPTVASSFAGDSGGSSTFQPAPHVSAGIHFRTATEFSVLDRDVLFANALDNMTRSPGMRSPLDGELEILYLLNDVARCGLDPESWLGEHGLTIGGLVKRILRLWVENGHKALTADMLLSSFRSTMLYSQPSHHLQSVFNSQLAKSRKEYSRRKEEEVDVFEDDDGGVD